MGPLKSGEYLGFSIPKEKTFAYYSAVQWCKKLQDHVSCTRDYIILWRAYDQRSYVQQGKIPSLCLQILQSNLDYRHKRALIMSGVSITDRNLFYELYYEHKIL